MERLATGASYPAVSDRIVKQSLIPLPPLEEQRRIASILDAADALRTKRRQALEKLDSLTQSIFIDMFGQPAANPHGFEVVPLIDLVAAQRPITYGILKPGEDRLDGVPYVRVVDMVDGSINAASLKRTSAEISHQYRRSLLLGGDLLMSIRGHVGRLASVENDVAGANITQDTARLAIGAAANPVYVLECLRTDSVQRWMATFTKGAAVRGINLTDLKRLPVPLPSRHMQDRFADLANGARDQRRLHRLAADRSDSLFASLQHRAFRGEL
jgi:type I restriction enzyme S subunit